MVICQVNQSRCARLVASGAAIRFYLRRYSEATAEETDVDVRVDCEQRRPEHNQKDDLPTLTKVFQSKLFIAFNQMCCLMKEITGQLSAKFETCRCCPDAEEVHRMAQEKRDRQRPTFLLNACPMVGKVAPYFAVGEHVDAFVHMTDEIENQLVAQFCQGLGDKDRRIVVENYQCAVAHMHYALKLKTANWNTLPWSLCGLAHPAASIANMSKANAFWSNLPLLFLHRPTTGSHGGACSQMSWQS